MDDVLRRYNVWENLIKLLLLFSGLNPIGKPRVRDRILLLIHVFSVFATSCVLLNFSRHNSNNLHLFLKGFGMAFSFLTVNQKMICMAIYRKYLVELHHTLTGVFGEDLEDSELQPILLSPLVLFYSPSFILSFLMWGSLAGYMLTPPIAMAIQYSRGVDVIKLILPFPAIYPWLTTGNIWIYLAHYMFEMYSMICLVVFSSLIDWLFGYYIFQICGQLRTLSHRLTRVNSEHGWRKVIRECVTRHQILIKCQDNLERIYGPIVLWMLITNSIVICSLVYQASRLSPRQAIPSVIIILIKSVQTLLYSEFGSFLTTESEKFREAMYASDWAGSGKISLMTDVLFMLTQRPLIINVCSVSTISADMFVAVCNTAISYFFMLRTLDQSNIA